MNENTKTNLRLLLELIDQEIQTSWLKDTDRTSYMQQLWKVFDCMLEAESLEEFFGNRNEDLEYFTKKFAKDTTMNILRQQYVYGESGDEIAVLTLLGYAKLWLKFWDKPYAQLWESVREIFDPYKSFYKVSNYTTSKILNPKKLLNAEQYNETLPKNPEKFCEFNVGDQVDLRIDNKYSRSMYDQKSWIRGTVIAIENEYYRITHADEGHDYFVRKGSLEITPVGKMTTDYDWRTSLKKWDVIDVNDRGRWFPATILAAEHIPVNGHIQSTYRVGFRLYIEKFQDWNKYTHFWHDDMIHQDAEGEKFIGDAEGYDESIVHYSKRIQQFNSMISKENKMMYSDYEDNELDKIDDFYLYESKGKKNYIIGRGSQFACYFALLLREFGTVGGFEKITNILSEKPNPDALYTCFHILSVSSGYFHKGFINEHADNIMKFTVDYMKEINQNDIRNLKKDTVELIIKVLTAFNSAKDTPDPSLIEEFSIITSFRMLKTSIFEKRLQAIKTLVDIIKQNKHNHTKAQQILKLIEDNNIIYEIFGPNTHIQLISKGKELLELMLSEDKLSDKEIILIWSGTQKGDLEAKLTILKMLKEVSMDLKANHVKILLQSIYASISDDISPEEIDLIYQLSTINHKEEDIEKCIGFFTKCVLNSKSFEGAKMNSLLTKILEIMKIYSKYREYVINICIECLENNSNTIVSLKILTKFLTDPSLMESILTQFSDDTTTSTAEISNPNLETIKRLFEGNLLVNLFCANCRKYKELVNEYIKSNNLSNVANMDSAIKLDNFTYSQNIKARMEFIQMLQGLSSLIFDANSFDFTGFAYELLLANSAYEADKKEFFSYIQKTLEKVNDKALEERVYKIFEEKICGDVKSCQELSIQAFDSFMHIFLNINMQHNNLYTYQTLTGDKKHMLKVYRDPEKLIGFNILWTIVFESLSPEIMNKGIETLHTIYTNASVTSVSLERVPGTNETEVKYTVKTNYSDVLLQKCLNTIREVSSNSAIVIEEKRNKIKKCLMFMSLIIEESEKNGTLGIKSHSGLLKRKVLELRIGNSIGRGKDFTIRVYGNTTMFELKEIISGKVSVCADFLKVCVKNKEVTANSNGKTVLEMNIVNNEEISVSLNNLNNSLEKAPLIVNKKLNPELEKIFNNWFTMYSSDDKLTRSHMAQFISTVTNRSEMISVDDHRIIGLFKQYDIENNGYIKRSDFLAFYTESVIYRPQVVWENLNLMGVRNDLKLFSEPRGKVTIDKMTMPRYLLAHNEDFFNILFYLQDLHESIAKEAFQFICSISTNPQIFMELLETSTLKDSENIYKLIYSLQIIESFIEDIEIESENIDSYQNEESILGNEGESLEKMKQRKIEWIQKFINDGSFQQMINILNKQLSKNGEMGVMEKICFELLIKIIRIFFNSSLNKFEFYRTMDQILKKKKSSCVIESSSVDVLKPGENMNLLIFDEPVEKKEKKEDTTTNLMLKKAMSFQLDTNILNELFEGELGDKILGAIDYSSLAENLLSILIHLCKNSSTLVQEDLNIIENSFEFLIGVIAFSPEGKSLSEAIFSGRVFQEIFRFGIIHQSESIREKYSSTLIKFSKIGEHLQKYELVKYLFSYCLELFEVLSKIEDSDSPLVQNSGSFFNLFALLIEIIIVTASGAFDKEIVELKEIATKISQILADDLTDNDLALVTNNSKPKFSNELFYGYVKILTVAVENLSDMKAEISRKSKRKYDLVELVLGKIIFDQSSEGIQEQLAKMEYVPKNMFTNKINRNSHPSVREACFSFILAMLKNSIDNFETFFSMNSQEKEKDKQDIKRYKNYYTSSSGKREGYVGLRNLGCICYMNSMMQQIFNVPTFRYAILQANDNKESCISSASENIDDNVLHQLQRMYTYLEMSSREDFNPHDFCYSFKDFDGKPTNTSIQQDSQEFLNSFCDKIENCLRNTRFKYLINSVFMGKVCSQVICEACGTVSNRFEDFYNLTLEVANMKTLSESLEKFIAPEKIDEFLCETCQKKVTIIKRTSLAELPNVFIVHLKRFFMNYEIEKTEKINSKLEFPKKLNLKNYCIEELMKATKGEYETDEIYFKQDEYYEYHLVGVNVHMGWADGGHYFSYINTVRNGTNNQLSYDPTNEEHAKSWLKFNDSSVSKFNVTKLDEECYGGSMYNDDSTTGSGYSWRTMDNTQSAYLLIYERRSKTPLKVVVSEPEKSENVNIVSYKAEETSKIKKVYDISRLNLRNCDSESSLGNLYESYFYDSGKNEYFQLMKFFSHEPLIPKSYYLEVREDNISFQKMQNNLDENYTRFFEKSILLLEETISNMTNLSQESSEKFCNTFISFVFTILNHKEKAKLLSSSIDRFIHFLELYPDLLIIPLEFVNHNYKIAILDTLLNEESQIVTGYSKFITYLISMGWKSTRAIVRDYALRICDSIFIIFPQIGLNYVNNIYPVYDIFRSVLLLDEFFIELFYSKKSFCLFVTFLVGKESPCYKEYSHSDYWDASRMPPLNLESLVEVMNILLKRSVQYNSSIYIDSKKKDYITMKQFQLTENDIKCFQVPQFLQMIYQTNDVMFTDLMIILQSSDCDFTVRACEEITKYIDNNPYHEDQQLLKLANAIIPILRIQDQSQLERLVLLIGYPRVIIDEPNYRTNWPLLGFNKLSDLKSKWLCYYTKNHEKSSACLLGKISTLKLKKKLVLDLFFILLEDCACNNALLKYLWMMPAEEPKYKNFIDWGIDATRESGLKDYEDRLNALLPKVVSTCEIIANDSNILPGFQGFVNNYIPYKIKREEIRKICQGEGVVVLRFDYLTSVIKPEQITDFKQSASSYGSLDLNADSQVIDEQNISTSDEIYVMDVIDRKANDWEFIHSILPKLNKYKMIVVQDSNYIENPQHTLIRYVAFSCKDIHI